ncbi:hypothetical protein INR49_030332 [Caranx melampygus]|nr:hypothetical protein INR49_030332 [Caranx melampygus]
MKAVGMHYFDCSAFVSSMPSNQAPLKRDTAKIRLDLDLLFLHSQMPTTTAVEETGECTRL